MSIDGWWLRILVYAILILSSLSVFVVFVDMATISTLRSLRVSLEDEIENLEILRENLRSHILSAQSHFPVITPSISTEGPIIYFITPTVFRPAQKADLTRLSQTLSLVHNLHWIVVEDSAKKSKAIEDLLKRCTTPYTHLFVETAMKRTLNRTDSNYYLPRGVDQRNLALRWLRLQKPSNGIVYFGDDDNTYDLRLFKEIRTVEKVGVWPVGIVGGRIVETPIVKEGAIVGFDAWKPERPFALDMAAFAIHITLLLQNPAIQFSFNVEIGGQESQFLSDLGLKRSDLEPKAENCTKVYVWHTRTEKTKLSEWDLQRVSSPDSYNFSMIEIDALGIFNKQVDL